MEPGSSDSNLQRILIDISIRFINLPVERLDAAINSAMAEIGEYLGADRFYVFIYNWEDHTVRNSHEWCAPGIEPAIQAMQNQPLAEFADWVTLHREGRANAIEDVTSLSEDSALRALLIEQSVQSLIAVPMFEMKQCTGFVGMDFVKQHRTFTPEVELLLRLFAEMLANVRMRLASVTAVREALADAEASREALRASEEKYRNLINSSDAVIVMHDAEGRVDFINQVGAAFLGRKPHEIEGRLLHELFPAEQADRLVADGRKVIVTGKGEIIEQQVNLPSGVRWFRSSSQPVRNDRGEPIGVLLHAADMTERVIGEERLRKNEEKYRSLVESSSSAIVMYNADGVVLFLNQIAAMPYGKPPEALTGMNVRELFPPDQAASILTDVRRILATGKGEVLETCVTLGGQDRWFRTSCQPVKEAEGKVYAVMMYATEITYNKQAELKVQRSERNYRSLFINSPQAYLILDRTGAVSDCNRAAEILFGAPKAAMAGKRPADVAPAEQPNGQNSVEYTSEIIQETIRNGTHSFEWMFLKKDGRTFLAQVSLALMEYEDSTVILAAVQDITERKLAEREVLKFKQVLSQSNYGAGINTLNGDFLFVNEAFASMHGYTAAELQGKSLSLFHTPEQLEVVGSIIKHMMETGSFSATEIWHKRKDGSVFPTLMSGTLIKDETGKPAYISATAIDISEMKARDAEIQKLTLAIEQSPVALMITDLHAVVQYVSPAFTKITGYEAHASSKIWKESARALRESLENHLCRTGLAGRTGQQEEKRRTLS